MNQHHSFDNDILDALTPDMPAEREAFTADTLDKADWCAQKAAAIYKTLAEKEAAAKRQIDKIRAWLDNERTKAADDASFFEGHATNYLLQVRQVELDKGIKPDKLTKTIKLTHGSIQARQQPASLNVTDDAAAIQWAKNVNPAFIRVKEELNKNEIKTHLAGLRVTEDGQWVTADGEIVDAPQGVELQPGHIKVSLNLPKE